MTTIEHVKDLDGIKPLARTPLPPGFRAATEVFEYVQGDVARVLSGGSVGQNCSLRIREGAADVEWFDVLQRNHRMRGLRTMEGDELERIIREGGTTVIGEADDRHYLLRRDGVRSGCTFFGWDVVEGAIAALAPVVRQAKAVRRPFRLRIGASREYRQDGFEAGLVGKAGDGDLRVRLVTGDYPTELGTPAQARAHLRRALAMRPKR